MHIPIYQLTNIFFLTHLPALLKQHNHLLVLNPGSSITTSKLKAKIPT